MRSTAKVTSIVISMLFLCAALTGCLVVGYSSQGGWWVWPGSIVVTLLLALLFLLARR